MTRGFIRYFLSAACLAAVLARPAAAVTLTVMPAQSTVTPGGTIDVAVTISGLGEGVAPSLGGYDLDVSHDADVLSFVAGTFGDPALGDQLNLGGGFALRGVDDEGTGVVNAFELSLDRIVDLVSGQAGSFTLFTLTFQAAGPLGVTALDLFVNDLADQAGGLLSAAVVDGSITVVPVPGAWLLMLSAVGAAGSGTFLRHRRWVRR